MHLSRSVDHTVTHLRELLWPVPRRWNAAWMEWSNRLPPSAFLVWLAGVVANDYKSERVPLADMLSRVGANASAMQRDAERFLRQNYFAYRPFCKHYQRMLLVFRHLVQSRLRRRFDDTNYGK